MDNEMNGKIALKIIGLIFGGMFGVLFSIIGIFAIWDNIVYSTSYTKYDGVVKEADVVESYISTTTRYRGNGRKKRKVVEYDTRYRQDITVEYNGTIVEMEDISTNKNGYSVNEEIPIYVNNNNSEKVKIHADVSDKNYLYKFFGIIGGYWVIYIILAKKTKEQLKTYNR